MPPSRPATRKRDDELECDPAAGALDPLGNDGKRHPTFTQNPDLGRVRLCEIPQLEGPAGESCQHELDCTDCQPGWCATEVPELLNACETSPPFPFRFVLGAPAVGSFSVHILCDADPDE